MREKKERIPTRQEKVSIRWFLESQILVYAKKDLLSLHFWNLVTIVVINLPSKARYTNSKFEFTLKSHRDDQDLPRSDYHALLLHPKVIT